MINIGRQTHLFGTYIGCEKRGKDGGRRLGKHYITKNTCQRLKVWVDKTLWVVEANMTKRDKI